MKRIIFSMLICFASIKSFSQTLLEVPIQNISPDSNVVYRLFATRNMHTFIKLNTRNGKMWQIEWSMDSLDRYEIPLSNSSHVNQNEEKNGRFFLYPTSNIYTFILLDQLNGKAWQVQWGKDEDYRLVLPIN